MNRRQLLASLAALPFAEPARATTLPNPPAATAAEDMAIFRAAMAIHPGLHRYASPRAVAERLDLLERDYRAGTDIESYEACYLALSRFLATIRCGHSYCNFFNQTDPGVTALFDRPTRLPFNFEWLGREMVVTADHSGTGALPRGARVIEINGKGVDQVLARLLPYTRADGSNDGKRRSLLGVRGDARIEYFDVFQGLLMPPPGGAHRLTIVTANGRARTLDVPAIDLAARRGAMTRVAENSDQPRWTWVMRPDSIAVLDMPGWAMWNSKWDWRAWLDDRLDSLVGARGLVIDIRANEGGYDCGNPILARLIENDLQGWNFEERLRFTHLPDLIAPHVSTWDDSFRTMGVGAKPVGGGFYERPGTNRTPPIRRDERRLSLPVAALIGPANSSATFGFANAARASGKVRLFGEPTGGNRRGMNGGAFFFTKLPGSGIEFDLPLVGYFSGTRQPDAGLDPDVLIPRSARDLSEGHDAAKAAAIRWISRS